MKGMILILYFTILLIPGSLISQTLQINAGNDTTIYFGYGPGTSELTATATGGFPPYLYVWSTGDSSQSIIVNPQITTKYIVTVKDSLNNIARDTVNVKVIDVRCGSKNDKVLVCHKGITICIDEHAVPAHLEHGDILDSCLLTGVEPVNAPADFRLYNNYPNPFNPVTTFRFDIPANLEVVLQVFDVNGKMVKELVNQKMNAGSYHVDWNAAENSSGIYFCTFMAGSYTATQKIVLIK
ncbi:MAG: T9SS type A sorting domain-containing protein [Ignavibacteria bacterium]|nr:T9SS type A sorting domain-containing protein [Ignavibacteria bacterium]